MGYERLATLSTGEWSEYRIERFGSKYYLSHSIRVTGSRYPMLPVRKADAIRLSKMEEEEFIPAAESLLANAQERHYIMCH